MAHDSVDARTNFMAGGDGEGAVGDCWLVVGEGISKNYQSLFFNIFGWLFMGGGIGGHYGVGG